VVVGVAGGFVFGFVLFGAHGSILEDRVVWKIAWR
jgi:hypothetical protein